LGSRFSLDDLLVIWEVQVFTVGPRDLTDTQDGCDWTIEADVTELLTDEAFDDRLAAWLR